jgi:putative acetyltransferase
MPAVTIRPERAEDRDAIRAVNDAAFAQPAEGTLVDALRRGAAFIPALSLVAVDDRTGAIVGHILFTRLPIVDGAASYPALALAPMAVLPGRQREGIGSALVREGLAAARRLGHRVVVVLGHPEYYPRFGFLPARAYGIECPFDAPDEAFMALGLCEGALDETRGRPEYPREFLEVPPETDR